MDAVSIEAVSMEAVSMEAVAVAAEFALALCDRIATYTDVPGTVTRLFLSPATREVHALLRAEMEALGMAVRMDGAGNLRGLYGALEGTPEPGTLLLGSHIDTVPDAGRYDGILGVCLPLALLRLVAPRRFPFAVELIAFSEEEGVRFRTPFIGSRALTRDAVPHATADGEGKTVGQALHAFAVDPEAPTTLSAGTFAFVEVHIEQGPVLEALGAGLGVVTSIVGQTRLAITFTGESNHAGTTPMTMRRDALAAAAAFIVAVEAYARTQDGLVATVGVIDAGPGAPNIIPGRAAVSVDLRHPDDCTRLRARMALTAEARRIGRLRGVSVGTRQTSQQAAVPMDEELSQALREAARMAGQRTHDMASGAGHDSMILAPHVPTAMLFLRTPGGRSHHPQEAVLREDVEAALCVLHCLLARQMPHFSLHRAALAFDQVACEAARRNADTHQTKESLEGVEPCR